MCVTLRVVQAVAAAVAAVRSGASCTMHTAKGATARGVVWIRHLKRLAAVLLCMQPPSAQEQTRSVRAAAAHKTLRSVWTACAAWACRTPIRPALLIRMQPANSRATSSELLRDFREKKNSDQSLWFSCFSPAGWDSVVCIAGTLLIRESVVLGQVVAAVALRAVALAVPCTLLLSLRGVVQSCLKVAVCLDQLAMKQLP